MPAADHLACQIIEGDMLFLTTIEGAGEGDAEWGDPESTWPKCSLFWVQPVGSSASQGSLQIRCLYYGVPHC
jgi:hypothetical protein